MHPVIEAKDKISLLGIWVYKAKQSISMQPFFPSLTFKQLKDSQLPGYLIKDNVLHTFKNEIPLFHCGFLH
jgi:hypothetical protein